MHDTDKARAGREGGFGGNTDKQKNEVIVDGMQSPFKFEIDVYRQ